MLMALLPTLMRLMPPVMIYTLAPQVRRRQTLWAMGRLKLSCLTMPAMPMLFEIPPAP